MTYIGIGIANATGTNLPEFSFVITYLVKVCRRLIGRKSETNTHATSRKWGRWLM